MPTARSVYYESHEPTKGKLREVYLAIRVDGQQLAPTDQILNVNGGYQATVTISTATVGSVYDLTLNGIYVSYTAVTGDTVGLIAAALLAKVNALSVIRRTGIFAGVLSAGTFKLIYPALFTATTVSTNMTIGTIATVTGSVPKLGTQLSLFQPLTGEIQAFQYLTFADSSGIESVIQVAQYAPAGATNLQIFPAPQAIAGGAISEYPPYIWDRTAASIERTFANSNVNTFNSGGARDGSPTTSEKSISLPGVYNYSNAAYKTALYAAENGQYVHVRVYDPPPNPNFITGPLVVDGRALVTAAPSAATEEGQITADLTIAFMGPAKSADPIPA